MMKCTIYDKAVISFIPFLYVNFTTEDMTEKRCLMQEKILIMTRKYMNKNRQNFIIEYQQTDIPKSLR